MGLQALQLLGEALFLRFEPFQILPPEHVQHARGDFEEVCGRPKRLEELFELAFYDLFFDRLAIARTVLGLAIVIGIGLVPALRPAAAIGRAAIPAKDKAPQREVGVDILTHRRARLAVKPLLNPLIGLIRDQRGMLGAGEWNVPGRIMDIARIMRPGQQRAYPLDVNTALALCRIIRMGIEEALNLDLAFKPASGKAFQRFGEHTSFGLFANELFAAFFALLVCVPRWRAEDPIAIEQSRTHAFRRTVSILNSGMLHHHRHHLFWQLGDRIIRELHRGGHQLTTGSGDFRAELNMGDNVPGQPRDIIDQDDIVFRTVLAQKAKHLVHTRALGILAGHGVHEHLLDTQIPVPSIIAAIALLGA